MNMRIVAAGLVGALLVAGPVAKGQFFDGGFFNRTGVATLVPEVGVVRSGTSVNVAPVVSHDRKYVTISTQLSVTRLTNVETFSASSVRFLGLVGGVQPAQATPATTALNMNASAPVQIQEGSGGEVLSRTGMTRIAAR